MLFNSFIFIMLFLPLCLLGYFGLNNMKKTRLAQVFLLGMSLWFYGFFNPWYIILIVSSVLANYLAYSLINKYKTKAKLILILALVFDLGVLGYFKYMDFFIGNINSIFKTDLPFLHIALPLGISFFTFQQISFIVDAYRGEIPQYGILEYACFVTYFPQLIAGPIVTHDELVPQLRDENKKKFNYDNFSRGFYIFVMGLGKKLLLADTFGKAVDYGFAVPGSINSLESLLVVLGYSLQLYFDFSGYNDMAIGVAKMMNLDLPFNFNSPYKSVGIGDLWKRWHITLGRFLTKYVYIPLGGSKKGLVRSCINTMIVFLISGLWHGAAWTYVAWGAINGLFIVLEKLTKKVFEKIPRVIRILYSYIVFVVSLPIFRANSFKDAFLILGNIFKKNYAPVSDNFLESFRTIELKKVFSVFHLETLCRPVTMICYFVVGYIIVFFMKNSKEKLETFKPKASNWLWTLLIFIWSIYSMTGISIFLYFNF